DKDCLRPRQTSNGVCRRWYRRQSATSSNVLSERRLVRDLAVHLYSGCTRSRYFGNQVNRVIGVLPKGRPLFYAPRSTRAKGRVQLRFHESTNEWPKSRVR